MTAPSRSASLAWREVLTALALIGAVTVVLSLEVAF
jgi:hypothetical protein